MAKAKRTTKALTTTEQALEPIEQPIILRKLTELKPDARNANKGTLRGRAMLEDSLQEDGAGRGILLDKHGNVIAGNKTLETAVESGFEDVIIVPTDGKTLVATQRTDVDIDSPQGRRMAIRDNRVAQVDLDFDGNVLAQLQTEGLDLSQFWDADELAALAAIADWSVLGNLPSGDKSPFQQMTFTVSDDQAAVINSALKAAKGAGAFIDTGNENSNGNALARICESYVKR